MADNQKKENFFKRAGKAIVSGAKATKSEVKKISWPTRKQLLNNTVIVVACIAVIGVVIFALDAFFGLGFNFLTNRKANSDIEVPTEISTDFFVDYVDEAFTELATVEVATEPAE